MNLFTILVSPWEGGVESLLFLVCQLLEGVPPRVGLLTLRLASLATHVLLAMDDIFVKLVEHLLVASGVAVLVKRMLRSDRQYDASLLIDPLRKVEPLVYRVNLIEVVVEFLILVAKLHRYALAAVFNRIVELAKAHGTLLLNRAVDVEVENHHLVGLAYGNIYMEVAMLGESPIGGRKGRRRSRN